MSCTTTVYGSGLNASTGGSLGNYGNYVFNGRATLVATTVNGFAGLQLYLDGVNQGNNYVFYTNAYIVSTTCEPLEEKYDCINGACTANTTYGTPGIYQTLSECETACGTGCSGKCISNSDWSQIEGLANQLKQSNCS